MRFADFRSINPSAENIARLTYDRLAAILNSTETWIDRVTVWENAQCSATYFDEAQRRCIGDDAVGSPAFGRVGFSRVSGALPRSRSSRCSRSRRTTASARPRARSRPRETLAGHFDVRHEVVALPWLGALGGSALTSRGVGASANSRPRSSTTLRRPSRARARFGCRTAMAC